MQHQSPNVNGNNMGNQTMTNNDELSPRKPSFTMHNLFLVLMVMFFFSLAFVLGFNYFSDNAAWHGQTMQYLCPGLIGSEQQVAICVKG